MDHNSIITNALLSKRQIYHTVLFTNLNLNALFLFSLSASAEYKNEFRTKLVHFEKSLKKSQTRSFCHIKQVSFC